MRKRVGKGRPPERHLPTWALMIDGKVQGQVVLVPLNAKVPAAPYGSVTQGVLGKHEYYDKCVEKWLLQREKILKSAQKTYRCKQELDEIYMCLEGIQESRSSRSVVRQILTKPHGALRKRTRLKKVYACCKNKAQDSTKEGDTMEASTEKEMSSSEDHDMRPDDVIALVQEMKEVDSIVTEKQTASDLKPTNSDGENGNPNAPQLITCVLSSNEIHVKDECTMMEDPKVGIQDTETPKPSFQMDTELPTTTDINLVNVDLNQHHKNSSDGHDVIGQSITVKTESMSAEVESGETLKVLNTELSSSPVATSHDENMTEHVVNTGGHVEDTASSETSPQKDIGLSVTAEMSSDQDVNNQHQTHQNTTTEVSELLKEDTLEAQLAFFKTGPSTSLTIPVGVDGNESSVASSQKNEIHAVTTELGTDLEIHEGHHKKDTEESEHVSVVLKEETQQVLLKTAVSPLTTPECEDKSLNEVPVMGSEGPMVNTATSLPYVQQEDGTSVAAEIGSVQEVSVEDQSLMKQRTENDTEEVSALLEPTEIDAKEKLLQECTVVQMKDGKTTLDTLSVDALTSLSQEAAHHLRKEDFEQSQICREDGKNSSDDSHDVTERVSECPGEGKSQSEEATLILPDAVLPVHETVPHGALEKRRRRRRGKKARAGSKEKTQNSTSKGDTIEASTEKEMASSKGHDGEISLVQEVKEFDTIVTENQAVSELPAMESEKNEDRLVEVCDQKVSDHHQETLDQNSGGESEVAKDLISELLKPTDCEGEAKEAKPEGLQLQMDAEPSCSIATPPTTNVMAGDKDTTEKDAVFAEGKTSEAFINEELHPKVSRAQDKPVDETHETNISVNLKQGHDQGKALRGHRKQKTSSVPQKKAVNSTKKPSQKAQRREENRRRKVNLDSPREPCEKEKMVISAVKEIWQAYDLGQGPKNLAKLPAPRPSGRYMKDHGQHIATSLKEDYLRYVFHLTWMILHETYPKPSESQSANSKTNSNRSNNISQMKHFSFRADFQDTIIREVVKRCGPQRQGQGNQQAPPLLVDETEFIQVKVTERMFENALKKSNEKRYLEWKHHTSPANEGKCAINDGEHSKGDSALLTTTTLAGNALDKDVHYLKLTNSDGENGKLTRGVLSSSEIQVKDECNMMDNSKVGIQDTETPKPSLQVGTELLTTTDINSVNVDLNQHHKNNSDSHDVSGQGITSSPTMMPESMSAEVESGETLKVPNTELSSSPAATDETMNKEHVDTKGHVEDTASSGTSLQQDKDLSVSTEMSSDQDVKDQHQTHQDTKNATKELSELLKDETLEAQLFLLKTEPSTSLAIPVKDECNMMEDPKVGIQDTETPKASLQMVTELPITTDINLVNVGLNQHNKNNNDSHDVSGQSITSSPTVKAESMSAEVESGETLKVLNTELSSSPAETLFQDETMNKEHVDTKGHVEDTASSGTSPQQDKGLSVTAEMSSDQDVKDQHQTHQDTKNVTKEVSELLKEETLEAQLALLRTEPSASLTIPSEDECVKDISLRGTKGGVEDNESSVGSSQRDKCHAVTAELGTDLEVHEKHHKKDTEDPEHVSLVLKEKKLEIQQILLKTELSPLATESVDKSLNEVPVMGTEGHTATSLPSARPVEGTPVAADIGSVQEVSVEDQSLMKQHTENATEEVSPLLEPTEIDAKEEPVQEYTVVEMTDGKTTLDTLSVDALIPFSQEAAHHLCKENFEQSQICHEDKRDSSNDSHDVTERVSECPDEVEGKISELLKPTDCEGEAKEAKPEGLQLQMDADPSCSIATPPTTNVMAGDKDTTEKDAVFAEGKTSEAFINEELHPKVSRAQDKPVDETHETNISINLKQGHDQGKVLRGHRKQKTSSVPQKKAVNSTKKPSQKAQRREENRRRKVNLDSPREPCEKEKMVISAVKEIWQAYDLGQGPKNLAKLPAPRPSGRYMKDHGQHIATSLKEDYLRYVFHLTWMILHETYPKPSESQSANSKTNSNRSNNISQMKHFSFRADFQDTIIREVVKRCGLQRQGQGNQQAPPRLVDETEFIQVKVTERKFENALKKSNEKRYLEWKHHTSPASEGKCAINDGEHSKGDSALLTATTLAGNALDKDVHHLKLTNSDGENGKLTRGVLSSSEIQVKDECNMMDNSKVGIQDTETPKPSLQVGTELLTTTDINSVNVDLNQHHKNNSDSHDVGGQGITSSPTVKPESMSAEVESGETLKVLNIELSSSPAATDETMNKEYVDTKGHVEDTASSGTSLQQDKDLSVSTEMSSDQDVKDQHQTHQDTKNATKEVSELLKEETLEAPLVLLKTEPSTSLAIPVKDECNMMEDPKVGIQDTETPKASLQMVTELPITTDINLVNVGLNQHHKNNNDSHDVSGQSITSSPTVKAESMSAEVESGETLKVLNTELSSSPAETLFQDETMNKEHVDTKGHVEDTASSGTSPHQDKGLSVTAEMSSDQDVKDQHQTHQDTKNVTKEVSELLKEETLEAQLALLRTEPSASLTISSEDECVKDISLRGTKGGVEDNESSVGSSQRDKCHAVTAELDTDLEVHEKHHKKDTEDPEHVSLVLKEKKLEIQQILLKTELSPLATESVDKSLNEVPVMGTEGHTATSLPSARPVEGTPVAADIGSVQEVSVEDQSLMKQHTENATEEVSPLLEPTEIDAKEEPVQEYTVVEMTGGKTTLDTLSVDALTPFSQEAAHHLCKENFEQSQICHEDERDSSNDSHDVTDRVSECPGEDEGKISELLKPTDCEGEAKEAKPEGLQLQMDAEPSCSIATPPTTNVMAGDKDTTEKDAVLAEGKTSEAFINEELHPKVSKAQDKPADETHETNISVNLKQGHDQGKALRGHRKQKTSSVPQKKAVNSTKKPSQKTQRKEEKRRRKANMDSPWEPCVEKMVISAVKEITNSDGENGKLTSVVLSPSEVHVKDECNVMEEPKEGIQDTETPKQSLQMDTELPTTTDINPLNVDLNQHHKNNSDSHDVSGQSIISSPTVKAESMSAEVESVETLKVLNTELSSSPAATDETMNKEHVDTKGHVEDTASSGTSPQQDKGLSVSTEMSSDQDVKDQHQTHQDTENTTKEVSELLKEETLDAQLALFKTEDGLSCQNSCSNMSHFKSKNSS